MFRRMTAIATALATTATLATAASPAGAIYRDYEAGSGETQTTTHTAENDNKTPVDENGKESCHSHGDWHKHGTTRTMTWTNSDGKAITQTDRCNNGKWEPVVSAPSPYYDLSQATYDLSQAANYYEPTP